MDHLFVDAVQLKLLGFDVPDEPDRVVDPGQGLDDGGAQDLVGFRLPAAVGDIRDEHIIETLVNVGRHIMAVVVDPARLAVPAEDAVFHMVLVIQTFNRLPLDRGGDGFVVLRVDHPPEAKAGQSPEVLQAVTAEDLEDRLVGIQQFLALVGLVNEEAAGHMLAQLFDDRKALLIQDKISAEHRIRLRCSRGGRCMRFGKRSL